MNIKGAKEEIKHAVKAYLLKDEFGEYKMSPIRQRPILLMGPPGIGKTAIMEQISRECSIGLVAYTITHHTRQSAIGLPFIQTKKFGDQEYSVTEYTMSEIIASVYEKIETTGLKEGILFLDEINCVSETLAPAMLQFLQCKTFGTHSVPEGWIIVAAGNPPEYNKSVREFDIVTLDRMKKIDVEDDFTVWKEYAYQASIHGAILSYLEIKKNNFYAIETTIDGKKFVTARGWEDLSQIIYVYEELKIPINENLIIQYLQHKKIAKDFANYLDLYAKYKNDYAVDEILAGNIKETIVEKLQVASFDERLSVIGLLLSRLSESFAQVYHIELFVTELYRKLTTLKTSMLNPENKENEWEEILENLAEETNRETIHKKKAGLLDKQEERAMLRVLDTLEQYKKEIKKSDIHKNEDAFALIKSLFDQEITKRKDKINESSEYLNHAFLFLEKAFDENQEMVVFITELTMNYYSVKFINGNGNDKFFHYNKELLFDEKQRSILRNINEVKSLM